MRCYNCGKECVQTGAQSVFLKENTYQTIRFYECSKCGKKYKEVDEPIEVNK
jgi:hypothetical protein